MRVGACVCQCCAQVCAGALHGRITVMLTVECRVVGKILYVALSRANAPLGLFLKNPNPRIPRDLFTYFLYPRTQFAPPHLRAAQACSGGWGAIIPTHTLRLLHLYQSTSRLDHSVLAEFSDGAPRAQWPPRLAQPQPRCAGFVDAARSLSPNTAVCAPKIAAISSLTQGTRVRLRHSPRRASPHGALPRPLAPSDAPGSRSACACGART